MERNDVELVRHEVMCHLGELSQLFKPDCKLTFIMHVPGAPDREMLITTGDHLDELLAVIERSKAREAKDTHL